MSMRGVDLQAYVNDSTNWAEEFFKSITTDSMPNLLVISLRYVCRPPAFGNQVLGMDRDGNTTLVNKHCMVLNAIDK